MCVSDTVSLHTAVSLRNVWGNPISRSLVGVLKTSKSTPRYLGTGINFKAISQVNVNFSKVAFPVKFYCCEYSVLTDSALGCSQ